MSTIEVGAAPRIALLGPPPVAPAHNLFTVALDLLDPAVQESMGLEYSDRVWGGVNVWPYPSSKPFGFDNCAEGTMRVKEGSTDDDRPTVRSFIPFTAYIPDACSAIGIGDTWEKFKERADGVLMATEAWAAERQLAHGQPIGGSVADGFQPSLNDTNLISLGADVGPAEGLALLEDAGGQTGRQYVIHATPGIATMWASNRLLLWTGDVIRTVATRTPVIVGHGYIDIDPDAQVGPSSDKEWAFVTGPVFAARGPLMPLSDDIAETLDRDLNDVVYRAEREILVGWDGVLQAGVLIDRSATP
jgi:hypothetical protein